MTMARPYAKLRGLMKEHDDTNVDLARLLLMTPAAISHRLNNRQDWKLGEMYAILTRYRLPHNMLHEVFPMNGKNAQ